MATVNVEINDTTWTQIAATTDDPVLAQKSGASDWYVALTDADSAPTVAFSHLLRGDEVVTRSIFGNGYIWAKNGRGSAVVIATK